ncbi:unnamed protein product [Spirodela intermedia]|uniref:Uncharacterized protein n=1 Tax=Spirodela intermedia TaxID=51605 RepID=A0A7I8KS81_SPIIN|nr:unnamed protein product [Spirodela intermedia]
MIMKTYHHSTSAPPSRSAIKC